MIQEKAIDKTYRLLNWNIFPWIKDGNSWEEIECKNKSCINRKLNKDFYVCDKEVCK